MTTPTSRHELVEKIATLAARRGVRVVTAESLTSGSIAESLGSGPDGSTWFGGGIVAYQDDVKFDLLRVREGPLVTATCAEQMAAGARSVLNAEVAVAATGVGGPDPDEGKPPGTVFVSVDAGAEPLTVELRLDGDPEKVLAQTVDRALELLVQGLEG